MPAITADAFVQQVRARTPAPVYVIIGDDDQEKSMLGQLASELVDEELRAFNVERLYGTDKGTNADAIVEAARMLPMLGDRRVIVVLRADALLKPKRKKTDEDEADEQGGADGGSAEPALSFDALLAYVTKPEPMTTLVLVADDIDRSRKLGKALVKQAAMVECWGLKPGKEVKGWDLPQVARAAQAWVKKQAGEAGTQIDPAGASLLADRAGTDISRLRGDWQRLLLYVGDRKKITREDVAEVASPETSQDDWAVTNAIERGDAATALRQLALAFDAGAAPQMMVGQLGWWVRTKLPGIAPGRVKPAIDALLRTDLDLKSSVGEPRVLMERLIVELSARR
ncbi:MAG: DNA polymerase III subunit delta [Acidobacteriota bacterium]|nr:DNA polymerase III subunit delta [Acidobacteriota bacterium]